MNFSPKLINSSSLHPGYPPDSPSQNQKRTTTSREKSIAVTAALPCSSAISILLTRKATAKSASLTHLGLRPSTMSSSQSIRLLPSNAHKKQKYRDPISTTRHTPTIILRYLFLPPVTGPTSFASRMIAF